MKSVVFPVELRVKATSSSCKLPATWVYVLFFSVGLFVFGAGSALAQNSGTIFGTVQDKTGAVIPNAKISITDPVHATSRTGKANRSGDFSFEALPIGTYQLTVSSPGFENYVLDGITLDAEQNIKEVIKLRPGSSTDSITVTADEGVGLDTKSATLGTVIDNTLVENLPIDGENVVALAALLPGVVDVNAPVTFTSDTGGPTFSANGGRNNQNLLLFDGLMFNNLFYNTGINYPPHPALQEVSVILNNYKAQYGRSAGSIFNVITKSGTNQFHGQVWDYIQNQMFNAADYISGINPEDNYHQFGGTVGGPILKDKLFFFGAFQQLIGRLQLVDTDTTPSYADRGFQPDGKTPLPCLSYGAFPGLTCANFSDQLYVAPTATSAESYNKFINPLDAGGSSGMQATPQDSINMITSAWQQAGGTGTPPCLDLLSQADNFAQSHPYYNGYNGFTSKTDQPTYLPYGEIPTACLNPVNAAIAAKYIPVPNHFVANSNLNTLSTAPYPEFDKNLLARADYHLSRHTIDARYNLIHSTATGSTGGGIATFNPALQYATSHFGNVGDTWVLGAHVLNVMHVGYKRFENGHVPTDHSTLADFGGKFVVPGLPTLPAISGGYKLGTASQGFLDTINENVELQEQLLWTHGNHTIGTGFNFLRLQYLNRSDYSGTLSYSSTFTRIALADSALGLVNKVQAQSRLIQGGIQHDVFTYLQDDWRATTNLTLNLGIRYELPFQWFEPHGQAATFIPGIQSHVFPGAPGGLGFPGDTGVLPSLVPTDFNGVAPRFGFAYDVSGQGKFVIRGGYGIFFDAVNANVVGVGEPYHYLLNKNLPPGGASNPLLGYPAIPASYDPKNPVFLAPYSIFFPDKNFRTPYVQAANFGFQYKVSRAGSFQANYVARLSRKLTIPLDLNPSIYDCSGGYFQADPARYCTNASSTSQSNAARSRYADFNYGGQGIIDILSVGTGNYNALQVLYTQRSGKRLNIMTSYTFAKSIDLQTNGQTTSNTAPNVFNIKSEKGPADSDSRHVFTLGWVMKFPVMTQGSGFTRALLNGWIYSGKYLARTGHPFSVTINDDQALNGEPNQRAALVPGANPRLPSNRHRVDKIHNWFNRYAFSYPAPGIFSTQSRNSFTGPAFITTDMNIGRDFPLTSLREGMRLNFRIEGFNVFNTPNLAQPKTSFSCQSTNLFGGPCISSSASPNAGFAATSTFATIQNTQGNNGNTQTTARKMQFAITIFY